MKADIWTFGRQIFNKELHRFNIGHVRRPYEDDSTLANFMGKALAHRFNIAPLQRGCCTIAYHNDGACRALPFYQTFRIFIRHGNRNRCTFYCKRLNTFDLRNQRLSQRVPF